MVLFHLHSISWGAIEDFILTVKYITAIKAFLLSFVSKCKLDSSHVFSIHILSHELQSYNKNLCSVMNESSNIGPCGPRQKCTFNKLQSKPTYIMTIRR